MLSAGLVRRWVTSWLLLATACTSAISSRVDVNVSTDTGLVDVPETVQDLPDEAVVRDSGSEDIRFDTDVASPGDVLADPGIVDSSTSEALLDATEDAAEVFVSPCGTCTPGTVCVWGTGACEPEMVLVPAGVFKMGCWGSYPDCDAPGLTDTLPAHEVDVPAFEIDRLEVTNADYRKCVETGWCSIPYQHQYADYTWLTSLKDPWVSMFPVVGVNWYQADTYCSWKAKRLCSEAEWEKAARGTHDDRWFPWGWDAMTCKYATTLGNKQEPNTYCSVGWYPDCLSGCGNGDWSFEPVGSHPLGASPYGVLDIAGNAKEWVGDYYHENYVGATLDGSPWLDPVTPLRAIRDSYTFMRDGRSPDQDAAFSGIRCCRDLEPRSGGEP